MLTAKPSLREYKFGEIAFNISERVEPKKTDLDIYVGLEHLDSEDTHIRRMGHPSQVEGTKLRVYPGDIIFGKRRAYQRKAAVADFNGICSAHAMVLRANPVNVVPEFLPYFIHSDIFMNRALEISEGSLSPTIKWKILAEQVFKLPPLDEQKRIVDLLRLFDKVIEKNHQSLKGVEQFRISLENEYFGRNEKGNVPLEAVTLRFISGGTPSTKQTAYWAGGEIPWITTRKMDVFYVNDGEKCITEKAVKETNTNIVDKGNILFGSRVGVGKCAITTIDLAINQDVTGIVVDESKIDKEYLFFQLLSRHCQNQILRCARGTTIKGITKKELKEIMVVTNEDEQSKIGTQFRKVWNMKQSVIQNMCDLKRIQQILINEIMSLR